VTRLDNLFKLSMTIAALLIGISVCYSFLYSPVKNRMSLENCFEKAHKSKLELIHDYCMLERKELGTDGLCETLPSNRVDTIRGSYWKRIDKCFREYPVK